MPEEQPAGPDELIEEFADVPSVSSLTTPQLDKLIAALPNMSVEAAKKLVDQVPALRDLVDGTLRMMERVGDKSIDSLDKGGAQQHELYQKLLEAIDDERKQPDLTPAERRELLKDAERVVEKADASKDKHAARVAEMFKTVAAVGGAAVVATILVVGAVVVAKNGDLKLDGDA